MTQVKFEVELYGGEMDEFGKAELMKVIGLVGRNWAESGDRSRKGVCQGLLDTSGHTPEFTGKEGTEQGVGHGPNLRIAHQGDSLKLS